MRIVKLILLAVVALFIIMLVVANRETVTVQLLPAEFGFVSDWSRQMPLAAMGGFALGWLWEWLRDQRTRTVARQRRRKIVTLEREVETLRRDTGAEEDEVLALLK